MLTAKVKKINAAEGMAHTGGCKLLDLKLNGASADKIQQGVQTLRFLSEALKDNRKKNTKANL